MNKRAERILNAANALNDCVAIGVLALMSLLLIPLLPIALLGLLLKKFVLERR